MQPRVDSHAFGPTSTATASPQQSMTPTGSLRGDACVAKDPAQMLLDAAEESSRELSHKVDEKSLGDRKVKAGGRPMVMSAGKCQEYLEKAKALDDEQRLEQFAQHCLKTGGRQAHELAGRQAPGNPTEQFVLLEFTRQQGKAQDAAPEVMAWIEAALENLWQGPSRQEIETRITTIHSAASYGQGAKEVSTFQASFDKLSTHQLNVAGTLDMVIKQLAGDRRGSRMAAGFAALIAATGQQIAACRSDPEKERLEAIVSTLNDLKVMNTVKAGCEELLTRTVENEARGA